jgi:hypothetical protein
MYILGTFLQMDPKFKGVETRCPPGYGLDNESHQIRPNKDYDFFERKIKQFRVLLLFYQ